jgi:hypothetical protein
MKVVCISGKARHGKDTLAGILKNQLEQNGKRVLIAHFGDLVKYVCSTFFAWDGNKDEKGRTLLQYIGTDVVRAKCPDFWTNFIVDILLLFDDTWDYVLIPDCRFPNEVECFKNNENFDVKLIRITRPDFSSNLTFAQLNHPSETAMDDYPADCYVLNDSNIEDLNNKFTDIMAAIG